MMTTVMSSTYITEATNRIIGRGTKLNIRIVSVTKTKHLVMANWSLMKLWMQVCIGLWLCVGRRCLLLARSVRCVRPCVLWLCLWVVPCVVPGLPGIPRVRPWVVLVLCWEGAGCFPGVCGLVLAAALGILGVGASP